MAPATVQGPPQPTQLPQLSSRSRRCAHLLCWQVDAQVTARQDDAICLAENLIKVLQALQQEGTEAEDVQDA